MTRCAGWGSEKKFRRADPDRRFKLSQMVGPARPRRLRSGLSPCRCGLSVKENWECDREHRHHPGEPPRSNRHAPTATAMIELLLGTPPSVEQPTRTRRRRMRIRCSIAWERTANGRGQQPPVRDKKIDLWASAQGLTVQESGSSCVDGEAHNYKLEPGTAMTEGRGSRSSSLKTRPLVACRSADRVLAHDGNYDVGKAVPCAQPTQAALKRQDHPATTVERANTALLLATGKANRC